jgi:hypothetical protein
MGFCEVRSDMQQARICKAMNWKETIKCQQSEAFEIVAGLGRLYRILIGSVNTVQCQVRSA